VTKAFNAASIPGLWSGEGLDAKFRLFQENTVMAEIDERWFRPAEVDLLHGDPTIAEQELGWKRDISFEQMIEDMVKNDIKQYK
jgi:GDPmannose 4,6-dehydratase